jgi:transposase
MMGKSQNLAAKLFYHTFSLEQRVPQDHPLRQIKAVVDFDFVRRRVASLYGNRGNESVDPAVILKLLFLMFYENVKSVRRLLSQLPLRLDWLWFCGYDIDDPTPDHSVISKARKRWGKAVFAEFFQQVLEQCIQAGLVDGQTIHIDASMIAANASMETIQPILRSVGESLYDRLEQQDESDDDSNQRPSDPLSCNKDLGKMASPTDPDARLGKKYGRRTLGYKDHRVVDDHHGIITATLTTPANANDEKQFIDAIQRHEANTGIHVKTAVADKAYGIGENYQFLHDRGMAAGIRHKQYRNTSQDVFTLEQFVYDPQQDVFHCPAGQTLNRTCTKTCEQVVLYQADPQTCLACSLRSQCVRSTRVGRQVQRSVYAPYYEWADHCMTPAARKRLLARRQYKAEGSFADAANNHGYKRARFRGLESMTIQNLLIAAIQNLRKLLRFGTRKAAATASTRVSTGIFVLVLLCQRLYCQSRRSRIVIQYAEEPI